MVFEDRKYQIEAEDALLSDVLTNKNCHPIVAIPTGAGKTKILSSFMYKYLEIKPKHSIVVVSHTENILLQDYEAVKSFFPGIKIGLYSSGLQSRTVEKITVAGIQSIYSKHDLFKNFNLVIIDEAHSVPTKGHGMYQQFFKDKKLTRVGLTGTHFRTGHGYIHRGEGALFNKLSYDLCTMAKFNKLVTDGYLTKLYSKPTELQLDIAGVKESAGDYNIKDLSTKFDRVSITNEAVKELVEFGYNYKSWLIFAINIEHANHISEKLNKLGIKSKALHSETVKQRHAITEEFKQQKIRCVVSVGMLTTGFDAPNIDLIALLRPTKSPVLHVQTIGRGLRTAPNKDHCLVLDFSGNIERLGPINNVQIPEPGRKKKGTGQPIVKACPNCGCLHHPTVKICDVCNHKFEFRENIRTTHGQLDIVQKNKPASKWLRVTETKYSIHRKIGMPNSLKVTYSCGLSTISEYVCYDHSGYAKHKANNWVSFRWSHKKLPTDVQSLLKNSSMIAQPSEILVNFHKKYPVIKDIKF